MAFQLTAEQRDIEAAIDRFIKSPNGANGRMWFSYTGAAGTGKSVLLGHLARKYPAALPCAFTGKAALVLGRKAGVQAMTIHSALYICYGADAETEELKFGRKIDAGSWKGRLVLVDEASTVSEWLAQDLLATGCKVVACGDRGQLPPVKGRAFFTEGKPDAELKEVHRQAWDSPIIRQAHAVRRGDGYSDDGEDFRVVRQVSVDELLGADIVLCWRNETRRGLNRLIRGWKGFDERVARKGEPVMALRNNPEVGVLNGGIYELLEDHRAGEQKLAVVNEMGRRVVVPAAWIEDFDAAPPEAERTDRRGMAADNPFAWGYCCTVHKSQGSEWDKVILVDEYNRSQDRDRFCYTALTRAAKSIIVQRNW